MGSQKKKYDVYGIGNALVDMVCRVDDKFFAQHGIDKGCMTLIDRAKHDELLPHLTPETREGGGSAANAMIAVRHLGGSGFYSCRVANDEPGTFYIDELHNAGLDTNLTTERLEDGVTGKCLVLVTPDAERTMNTYLGATELFSITELVENALEDSEYLYIEGYLVAQETAQPAAVEAVRMARKHGVKVALTFSDVNMITYFREGMNEIVGDGIDLILCNESEACAYAQTNDLATACEHLKRVAKTFAVTRGAQGTLIYDGSQLVEVPGQKVEAVDTVGAGDMFAGAFLYGITHGYSFERAAKLANLAASRVVIKYGPRLSVEEIQSVLSTFERNT